MPVEMIKEQQNFTVPSTEISQITSVLVYVQHVHREPLPEIKKLIARIKINEICL